MSYRARLDRKLQEDKERKSKTGLAITSVPPERKPDRSRFQPLPLRSYQPVMETKVTDLPIHFWFYVYIYSSEMDKVLAPFMQLDKRFPTDRRLMSIMNKAEVKIKLGALEFYKSLPRRIIIMQGRSWEGIIRAIFEMEDRFPVLMRYACYPILMDSLTLQFNCTHALQTAGIVRIN